MPLQACHGVRGSQMMEQNLSPDERRLLDLVQREFPITPEPYRELACRLDVTEDQVLERLADWRATGLLRRLGAVFDSHRLGYQSSLVAMKVPPERVEEVAAAINVRSGVTHNYLREPGRFGYNLWFTVTVDPGKDLAGTVDEIAASVGVDDVLLLPATQLYKIKVQFNLGQTPGSGANDGSGDSGGRAVSAQKPKMSPGAFSATSLDERDWRLIRALSEDLPLAPRPFRDVAQEAGDSEEGVLERVKRLLDVGVIRRFGATLKHYAVGFQANAMVVWRVGAHRVSEVGRLFAGFDAVSHCYERNTYPSWPYNLYTMIHCRTREECFSVAERLAAAAGVGVEDFELLFTKRELKKDRMRYGG